MAAEDFAELLHAAQRGNEAAFRQLFRETQPSLLKFLIVVAGPDLADDIAADTWVNVVRDLERFVGDEIGAFRAWTLAIARRRWIDEMRRRGRRPEVLTDTAPEVETTEDVATQVERSMSTDRAIALLSTLPPEQAEVLMLRIIVDLDVGQTAQIVGKTPGAVRVLAHRGLRRLHDLLQTGVTKSDPGAVDG